MNGKIKFKAWDKETNAWYDDSNQHLVINLDGTIYNCWNGELMEVYTDRIVLLQYTGLKDKNDVEIYDRYIVHFKMPGFSGKGIVYWNEEVAQLWIEDIREQTKKRGKRYYPFYKDATYRIDGNVYENPELLGDAE